MMNGCRYMKNMRDIIVDERDKGIREVVETIEHMLEGSVRR